MRQTKPKARQYPQIKKKCLSKQQASGSLYSSGDTKTLFRYLSASSLHYGYASLVKSAPSTLELYI